MSNPNQGAYLSAKEFSNYLNAAPGPLAALIAGTVDTTRAIKLGCKSYGIEISDDAALAAAVELLRIWGGHPLSEE